MSPRVIHEHNGPGYYGHPSNAWFTIILILILIVAGLLIYFLWYEPGRNGYYRQPRTGLVAGPAVTQPGDQMIRTEIIPDYVAYTHWNTCSFCGFVARVQK